MAFRTRCQRPVQTAPQAGDNVTRRPDTRRHISYSHDLRLHDYTYPHYHANSGGRSLSLYLRAGGGEKQVQSSCDRGPSLSSMPVAGGALDRDAH